MKKKSNKKKKLVAMSCLALLAAAAGTFAWVSSQDQHINRVSASAVKDGSVTIEENFAASPITPGTSSKKEVQVVNTGNSPVFARVSYEEVLKYMTSKGVETDKDTAYSPKDLKLDSDIPVEYDGGKYLKADSGYTDITEKAGIKLPENATDPATPRLFIVAKGSATISAIDGELKTTFTPQVFYRYATGKYQSVKLDVSVANFVADKGVEDWTYTIGTPKYQVYAGGYSNSVKNWAYSTLKGDPNAVDGAALLGSAGQKNSVDYDYTTGALGISAIPAPAAASADTVAANQLLADGILGNGITVKYDAITNTTDLADKSWVYNPEDGFFYYTTPLGASQTSNKLMNALVYGNELDTKQYNNATYDLVVKLEAIYGVQAALTDTAGWNMNIAEGHPTTIAIYNKLASQSVAGSE